MCDQEQHIKERRNLNYFVVG